MAAAPCTGTENGDGPSVAFAVEDCIVRGGIVIYSGETIGSGWTQALLGDLERLTASPDIDTLMRGYLESALCAFRHLTAEFDSALDRAARARQCLSRSPYMTMLIDIQVGQIAMAQGRVEDAGEHYRRARRIATKSFALDDGPAAFARVHLHELALECHRLGAEEELRGVPGALTKGGAPLSAYPAAAGAVIDLRLVRDGAEAALGADEMLEYVRGAGLPPLVQHLSALRVSVLAFAGRAAEAERAWRLEELPEAPEGCLDLGGQIWREMEALSCARLGLLIAGGRFDAGRRFAADSPAPSFSNRSDNAASLDCRRRSRSTTDRSQNRTVGVVDQELRQGFRCRWRAAQAVDEGVEAVELAGVDQVPGQAARDGPEGVEERRVDAEREVPGNGTARVLETQQEGGPERTPGWPEARRAAPDA